MQNTEIDNDMLLQHLKRFVQEPAQSPGQRAAQHAKRGNVMAQAALGTVYREGNGSIERSNSAALTWLGMAARQQLPYALNEIGEMYFMGQGTGPDRARARRHFVQAAKQGYAPAKLNLLQLDLEAGSVSAGALMESLRLPAR